MGDLYMKTYLNGIKLMPEKIWMPNYWINIEQPDKIDIDYLLNELNVPESFLKDIEDPEERPRIEYEDEWQMIILRIPTKGHDTRYAYTTVPLGIFLKNDLIISVCFYENEMIGDFIRYNQRKEIGFNNPYDLVLQLIFSAAVWYMKYLKQLNIIIKESEKELEKSIKNRELQALLQIEKCFVFFITSLKGNTILLHRIKHDKRSSKYIDPDQVEDVEIEMRQALETSNIYSDILAGMMDAYASVIGNNMGDIMKQLTSISLILMIPTLIASLYGMNVPNSLQDSPYGFPIILIASITLSTFGVWLFRKRRWF